MFNYYIESDIKYITNFYKILVDIEIKKWEDNKFISIFRHDENNGNDYNRSIRYIFYSTYVLIIKQEKYDEAIKYDYQKLLGNNIHIEIDVDFNNTLIKINNIEFNIGQTYAYGKTKLTSELNILNIHGNIVYKNLRKDIPIVFGDCITNLHTHKMFGKYFMENGANYHCINKPSWLTNHFFEYTQNYLNKLNFIPNKVFFIKKAIQHPTKKYDFYYIEILEKLYEQYPYLYDNGYVATIPRKDNGYEYLNNVIRTKFNTIDIDAYFKLFKDKDQFFIDEAHTSEYGALVIYKYLSNKFSELNIHYEI